MTTIIQDSISIVVIGNGMVAHRFSDLITKNSSSQTFDVTVYGEEPYYAYDRVHLSDHFYGKSFRDLQLADQKWYHEKNIKVHLNDPVTHVDIRSKTITTASGKKQTYDKLVFATGSNPFVPPIEGLDLIEDLYYYRNFSDLIKIRNAASYAKRAVVIGGGLLGLEAAKALTELNVKTHVIEFAHHLMPRQIDEGASNKLRQAMEMMNIHLHCRRQTKSITNRENEILVNFKDGDHIVADMVVIAAGIVPRDELARRANIACDPRGGILVDDQLKTSNEHIFAIGECAHHNGKVYGLVSPGYKMAEELSKHLHQQKSGFEGMDHSTRLKLIGIEVVSIGQPFQPGKNYSYENNGHYRRLTVANDRIIGVIAVGEWNDIPELQKRIDLQEGISASEIRTFETKGTLGAVNSGMAGVLYWPDNMTICNCMNVTKGQIVNACNLGCKNIMDISDHTGAGSVCGTCKPQLALFLGMETSFEQQTRGVRLLGFSTLTTLAIILIFIFTPSISYTDSVQNPLFDSLEQLWRNDFWKQVTGYTMLTLTFASMSLSLRKRIKSFSWGEYQRWRSVHILLIAFVFVFIPLHTGLRMGDNINLALMISYTLTAITGTLTGIAVWQEASPKLKY